MPDEKGGESPPPTVLEPTTAPKPKNKKADVQLPYLATPGSAKTALERIRQAATPERVTPDFVSTVLQMKGGTGSAIAPSLKKIGMVASDGAPTDTYKQFRNPATGGGAMASAIKSGYKALASANEYFYQLNDKDLQALIVQVTGTEVNSSLSRQIFYTLKTLKDFADFAAMSKTPEAASVKEQVAVGSQLERESEKRPSTEGVALNLAYTINLNLPATSDQAVFNAIFKSLKEHLLSHE